MLTDEQLRLLLQWAKARKMLDGARPGSMYRDAFVQSEAAAASALLAHFTANGTLRKAGKPKRCAVCADHFAPCLRCKPPTCGCHTLGVGFTCDQCRT